MDISKDKLDFFSIHNHTEYSNLRLVDCNIKLKLLIDEAMKMGLKGVCITDHECISGHIQAIQIAKELKDKDFKVGLGNEIYLVNSLEEVRDNYQGGGVTKFPHFILIAKDKIGYEAIRLLSTHAWGNSFKTGQMERVPTTTQYLSDVLLNPKYKGHVIGSSACIGGYIGIKYNEYKQTHNQKYLEEINNFISACKYIFGNDFYLELQPSYMLDQIEYNRFLIELSKQFGVKNVISTDTHYLNLNMKELHKSFLSSKQGDREVDDFYGSTYLMTSNELWEYMKDYIDEEYFISMLNNTMEIYNKIEFFDMKHDTIVPQISIPPFNTDNIMKNYCQKYEYINKYYNSEYLIDKYLLYELLKGMEEKHQAFDDINLSRINTELSELWAISEKLNSRLSSYYLLVQDLVNLMWTVSLIGIARGSATGFYICYLLGITQMNPIEFNLPHWRHFKYRVLITEMFLEESREPINIGCTLYD